MIFRMNKNLAWATMDRVNGYEKTLNGDLKNVYEKIMNEARSYDIPFVGYDKFIDMVAKSPKIVLQQGRNKMTIYIRWKRS